MENTLEVKASIVVNNMRFAKGRPPRDAVQVEVVQVHSDGTWNKLKSMSMGAAEREVRVLGKFWVEPITSG